VVRADWMLHSPVEHPIAIRVLLKAPLCDVAVGFAIADVEKKVENGDFVEHPTTHNFPGPYNILKHLLNSARLPKLNCSTAKHHSQDDCGDEHYDCTYFHNHLDLTLLFIRTLRIYRRIVKPAH